MTVIALGALMPKATVNKNSNTRFWKSKIGPARQGIVSPPARNAEPLQEIDKRLFCRTIVFRSDATHNERSFSLAENVQ